MIRSCLPAATFLVAILCGSVTFAQNQQLRQIEQRLDETREMIEEEQSTIALLEKQLKRALEKNDTDEEARLRKEIDQAYERLEKLRELKQTLRDLHASAEGESAPVGELEKRNWQVPQLALGGIDENKDLPKAQRERQVERDRRQRRMNEAPVGIGEPEPRKLRYLREALAALEDANERDLAAQVRQRIREEERRLDRRDDRDVDAQRDFGGGGLRQADPSDANRRPNRRDTRRNRDADRDSPSIDDLMEEMRRLREELRELQERDKDDG